MGFAVQGLLGFCLVLACFCSASVEASNRPFFTKCVRFLNHPLQTLTEYQLKKVLLSKGFPSSLSFHLDEWLDQFDVSDRRVALNLLCELEYVNRNRFVLMTKLLHQKLRSVLLAEGFVSENESHHFGNVDFISIYPAKSGELVSYWYRKVNGIRSALFHHAGDLLRDEQSKSDKALIILDDYAGTAGSCLPASNLNS